MTDIPTRKGVTLSITAAAAMFCAAASASAAYYPAAYLVSTNILSGRAVSGVDSFTYTLSAKPSGTTALAQFSQDSSTWYNSSGVSGGTDSLSTGSNTIDISGLGWSGANFYYRVKLTSDGADTPVLDDVSIVYTATAATWDGSSSNDWNTGANWDTGSAPGNYHDIVIPNGGSPVLSANEELGNLTIQTGGTFDLNGYDLTLNDGGAFSNFGTLRLHGDETLASFTNDTDSGTVEYDGAGTYTSFPAGNSYKNIRFTNSGNWTPDGTMDVDGTFTMTGGTFQQGAYRLNIAGNMTIESGAVFTKSGNGSLLVLDGDLTLENAAGANLGNVLIGSSPDTTTLSGSLIADSLAIGAGDTLVTNGYNVIVGTGGITNSGTIIASGGPGGSTSISTASGFVNHGTYTSGDSTFTLSGSFINKGTFTANTGSVILDGTNQTLSGSTTFYNLSKTVTSADTLTFTAGDTFTISNTLTLQGASSNLLSLRSSTTGTQWSIDPQGTRTIGYLDVQDSNNTNATAMDATGGTNTDSGGNTNWTFVVAVASSNETETATVTPSGGSRGGHDSPAMQARIAQAHSRILALYDGKRSTLMVVQEEQGEDEQEILPSALDEAEVAREKATLEEIAERRGRFYAMIDGTSVIYSDVRLDEWYAPYVAYVVEEEIATGYADETGKPKGEFGVSNPVTVAEVLKMALEAADTDLAGVSPPRNSSAHGTWASAYVAKSEALQLSILTSERNIHEPATRGEVVQTITEVMNFPLLPSWTDNFTDVPHNHRNARAIATAVAYEIVLGDTDEDGNPTGVFRPDAAINRAEVSKIIALVKEAFR
jgi:hypothetical protein